MSAEPVALPPGIQLVRALNPGPMTLEGTNTWVLHGSDGVLVVDPGPLDEDHLQAVARACIGAAAQPVVLVTHGHADHAAGAARLGALLGADVLDAMSLARRPGLPGGAHVLPTPGHTADSVCVVTPVAVLTGDTVLGRGTTVIDTGNGGRLDTYLASLRQLNALDDRLVLPGHGPVLRSIRSVTEALHAHRLERIEQVRAARAAGARTPGDVVALVYPQLAEDLQAAALRSTEAAFVYLDCTTDA